MSYTSAPENHNLSTDDIETWIDEIIDLCDQMDARERLIVYEFGKDYDLTLTIYKDEDFKRDEVNGDFNIVTICAQKLNKDKYLETVDDTEDTYVTDGSLYNELKRIWEHIDFSTL